MMGGGQDGKENQKNPMVPENQPSARTSVSQSRSIVLEMTFNSWPEKVLYWNIEAK